MHKELSYNKRVKIKKKYYPDDLSVRKKETYYIFDVKF